MPTTAPTATDEINFLAGVSSAGVVISPSFETLIGETNDQSKTAAPTNATYDTTNSKEAKWGSPTPGTASGTITYAYNPASNYTPLEQSIYQSSLALWSAEANVTFALSTDYANAPLKITRGTDKGAFAANTPGTSVAVGGNVLGTVTGTTLSIDTSAVPSFGPIASVNGGDGYPAGTIVHELGHVLGLGHAGAYNGTVKEATQQFSQFDTGAYTIMSYIDPKNSNAKYFSSYSVTGTNWGTYVGPETPMSLDIAAVQNLYGLPKTTPLSGGQVFGYSSNITGALAPYFDFMQNTTPVLTLWDAGGNNTLNLSGYTTASNVNLNPGAFTSANGLVNNIGIALNTAINTAIGGAGDDIFTVNSAADTIDGMAGNNTVIFSGNRADYALASVGGTVTATKTSNAVTDTLMRVATLQFADGSVQSSSIACFVQGTLIATPAGERAVEDLAVGDNVVTASGEVRPIRWIGSRGYAALFTAANPALLPVIIRAGALGASLPRRDLIVSPNHAMFLDGLLVPAGALVNGASIVRAPAGRDVLYIHVELSSHDLILAEGCAAETFLDDDSRQMFQNAADFAARYPGETAQGGYCAPRVDCGPAVDAIRDRLDAAAVQTVRLDEPGVHRFIVNAGVSAVRLTTASGYAPGDARRLGVAIVAVAADGVARSLDDASLVAGWHVREGAWRWTDGAALLLTHGATCIEVDVAQLLDQEARAA